MANIKKIFDKSKIKHKPGDVVMINYKKGLIKNLSENMKHHENIPVIIVSIIEKKILVSDFSGIIEKEYYIYDALAGDNRIELSEDDII